ncbi:MAG: HAD family hydrolase [Proteobacteria bacterium]|nr:HAD family hydrolase [Pseudomonadota bacterium]MDA1042957.1 HAD family hydrolase [Pseudomonadota bacterium]
MRATIQGLLFDKDGTLFDFAQSWGQCMANILGSLAPDAEQQQYLGQVVGFDLGQMRFARDSLFIGGTVAETAAVLAQNLPNHSQATIIALIRSYTVQSEMVPVVALVPLMQKFKTKGLKLGIATNDNHDAARAHLDAHGLLPYFDFIAGADSGFGAKPEAGMLDAFSDQMGLVPKHVAMVGDSRHDLLAGRAAGMVTVGVLTGIATKSDLADLADVVLTNIGDLPDWLTQRV